MARLDAHLAAERVDDTRAIRTDEARFDWLFRAFTTCTVP